jgi:hypothetical protein
MIQVQRAAMTDVGVDYLETAHVWSGLTKYAGTLDSVSTASVLR